MMDGLWLLTSVIALSGVVVEVVKKFEVEIVEIDFHDI